MEKYLRFDWAHLGKDKKEEKHRVVDFGIMLEEVIVGLTLIQAEIQERMHQWSVKHIHPRNQATAVQIAEDLSALMSLEEKTQGIVNGFFEHVIKIPKTAHISTSAYNVLEHAKKLFERVIFHLMTSGETLKTIMTDLVMTPPRTFCAINEQSPAKTLVIDPHGFHELRTGVVLLQGTFKVLNCYRTFHLSVLDFLEDLRALAPELMKVVLEV